MERILEDLRRTLGFRRAERRPGKVEADINLAPDGMPLRWKVRGEGEGQAGGREMKAAFSMGSEAAHMKGCEGEGQAGGRG